MDIIIDFKNIYDRQSLYQYLKDVFCNSEFYGNNLDALMEVLMSLKDKNIIIRNINDLKNNLGDYADKVKNTFILAKKENTKIDVLI